MHLIFKFFVAGAVQAGVKKKIKQNEIQVGDIVSLTPDPSNPYDPKAIACHKGDVALGYVPAIRTNVIQPYIEQNVTFYCQLAAINETNSKELILIEVFSDKQLPPGPESEYVQKINKDAEYGEFLLDLADSGIRMSTWETEFVESCKKRRQYSDKQLQVIKKLKTKYEGQVSDALQAKEDMADRYAADKDDEEDDEDEEDDKEVGDQDAPDYWKHL